MIKRIGTKKQILSRAIATALASVLLVAPMQSIVFASDADDASQQDTRISEFRFKYPAEHSFEEMNRFAEEHPYDISLPDKYDIQPDIANEEINTRIGTNTAALLDAKGKADRDTLAGSLSQETLDNALNATNFMRYSAGLQLLYIHTNDRIGGYQWRAQAGAALMAELNTINHNIDGNEALAAGIQKGVFDWAKAGPGGSNIVGGSGVANKMVNSFMPDIGNDRTGLSHRSYILNPGLSGTGFGAADLSGTTNPKTGKPRGSAVSMMVTYYGADPDGLSAVLWPAQKQPIETFQARGTWQMAYPAGNPYQGNPWSYFINTNNAKVDTSTLKVTLECDGKPTDVLDFNSLTATEKSENRLFTIGSSPLKQLIGFRPHIAYGAGDKVKVTIEGIVDAQGLSIPVTYDVHFFSTGTEPHPNLEQLTAERTALDQAKIRFSSDYAGTMYYLVCDAEQKIPTAEEVRNGTKVVLQEGASELTLSNWKDGSKIYYLTISATGADKDAERAMKSGEMSTVKTVDIGAYLAPSVALTDIKAVRESRSNGTVSFCASVAGEGYYVVRDASEVTCELSEVLSGTKIPVKVGENHIVLSDLTDTAAKSVFLCVRGEDGSTSTVTRIQLPAFQAIPSTVTPPIANQLTYNGMEQALISAGSANNGTMEYRLGDTGSFTPEIPAATDAGDYTVWYRVIGDGSDNNVAEQSISAYIKKADITVAAKDYVIQTGDKAPDLTAPIVDVHYTVEGLFGNDRLTDDIVLHYQQEGKDVVPDTTKAGVYDIIISGVTESADGNYVLAFKNGTLTISERISSGSGHKKPSQSNQTENTYSVHHTSAKNGSVSVNTNSAAKGSAVTITIKPDSGYMLASLTVKDRNGQEIIIKKQTDEQYTFIMPEGKVNIEPVFEPSKKQTEYSDVTMDSYYHDAVHWAAANGITEGTGENTFSPHFSCTRAQMVTFLWRMSGCPEPKGMSNTFLDVDRDAYYYKAVLWAIENGITKGTSMNSFSPNETVTRGQTVVFLHRTAGMPVSSVDNAFNDVTENDFYFKAVTWAAQNGITGGTGNGSFSPNEDCTRAQIVTLLYRANTQ